MHSAKIICHCLLLFLFIQPNSSLAQSDLELFIAVDEEAPLIYNNVLFTAILVNKGPQPATNTVVNCPFPANLAYVDHDAGDNFYNIGTRRWNIGSIGVGDTAFLELTLFTLATDGSELFWEVEFTDNPDPDSSPGNGNGTAALEDDEAQQTINLADLELQLTASQTEVVVGDIVEFTLTVVNKGPNQLRNPVGYIEIPDGLRRSNAAGVFGPPSSANRAVTWFANRLSPGQTSSQLFYAVVQDISKPITLYTQYEDGAIQGDPDSSPGNGTAPIPLEDDEAALTLFSAGNNDAPSVSLSTSRSNVNGPFTISLVFSEAVSGLESSDFQVANGQATQVDGSGSTYSLQVVPLADGIVGIQLPAATVVDADGNPNQASDLLEVNYLQTNTNQIDLELSLSVDDPSLVLFKERVFTLEVQNNGSIDATNVVIEFIKPEALATVRQTATSGFYSDWTGLWKIEELPAGGSATLDFTTFIRDDSNDVHYYGQVRSVDQEDVDSSPNNNPGPTPVEDDEVVEKLFDGANNQTDLRLEVSSGEVALLPGQSDRLLLHIFNESITDASNVSVDFSLPTALQLDNISSSIGNISNGKWDIGLLASGARATLTFDLSAVAFTPNNRSPFFAEVASASPTDDDSTPGNGNGTAVNEDDEAISFFSVISPNSCSIDQVVPTVSCNDNQTPAGEDDTYTFSLEIEGTSLGNTYNLSGDFTQDGIAYNDGRSFGPFNIADEPLNLVLTDATTPACNTSFVVMPPTPCSSGSEGVDLKVQLSSVQAEFRPLDFLDYVLIVENEGDEDASGVLVRFDKPEGIGITNSSTANGRFDQWLGQWDIGDLAAGQRVQIDLRYYVTSTELSLTAFAEVIAQDQTDFDSTPDNGNGQAPVEDDESVLELFTENYLGNANLYFEDALIGTAIDASDPTNTYELLIGNDGSVDLPAGARLSIYFVRNFRDPFDPVNPNPARLIEQVTLGNIPKGGRIQVSGDLQVPDIFRTNDRAFFLAFVLDEDNSIREWKEEDNMLSQRIFRARSCQGNFFITNNASIQTLLEGCTTVDGSIRIEGNDVNNLFFLYALAEVKGALRIENTQIRSLFGLQALQQIDSSFFIYNNAQLRDLEALENLQQARDLGISSSPLIDDLSAFTTIEQLNNLGIIDMAGLTDLQSLSGWAPTGLGNLALVNNANLQSTNGWSVGSTSLDFLTLINCPKLSNIDELSTLRAIGNLNLTRLEKLDDLSAFSNLEQLDRLFLEFNDGLTSLMGFEQLTTLKRLSLVGNKALKNFRGLEQLTEVDEDIIIAVNEGLESLRGLENLSRVNGNFQIAQQGELRTLDEIANLSFVGRTFSLQNNDQLDNLDGLSQLSSVGTAVQSPNQDFGLIIVDNDALEDCCGLLPLLTFGSVNGDVVLRDNPGCQSVDDILTNCTQNRSSDFKQYFDYEGMLPYKVLQTYPNPVQDALHLRVAAKADNTEIRISLHDLTGRKMAYWTERLSEGLNNLRIDAEALPAGAYYLQLHTQGKQRGIPFVKARR
ncbi:MAG: Ig-like domain-containing protein [Bacteroidota bacterium]